VSVDLLNAAVFHPMPAPMKAVLTILSLHADRYGVCWPSVGTIMLKTGLGERTVRRAIADLKDAGWMTISGTAGGVNRYRLDVARIMANPCRSDTPADPAPLPERHHPMPQRQDTPATAAGNKSVKDQETSGIHKTRAKPKNTGPLPADWKPEPFGPDTKSASIMAGWNEEMLQLQLEKFRAHHSARDTRFSSWQQAWATWVLNSPIYHRGGNNGRTPGGARPDQRDGFERAIDRSAGFPAAAS
jgi:hypothetical protein